MKRISMDFATYEQELAAAYRKGFNGGMNEAANIVHRVNNEGSTIEEAFELDDSPTIGQGRLIEALKKLTGRY